MTTIQARYIVTDAGGRGRVVEWSVKNTPEGHARVIDEYNRRDARRRLHWIWEPVQPNEIGYQTTPTQPRDHTPR